MVYAYIQVSTDKQTVENQEYEIYKYADENELTIDKWIKETVSGTKSYKSRKLGTILYFSGLFLAQVPDEAVDYCH